MSKSSTAASTTLASSAANLAVVAGRLSSPPRPRTLPSGDVVWQLEVTVDGDQGRRESIPVQYAGPEPPAATDGDAVLVLGRVRRRFFRAGGTTASRTEVVADRLVVGSERRRLGALQRFVERLVVSDTPG